MHDPKTALVTRREERELPPCWKDMLQTSLQGLMWSEKPLETYLDRIERTP